MNNINLLATSIIFDNGVNGTNSRWWLLAIIPCLILAFIPYFRLKKEKRRTRNRIVSMILHLIVICLVSLVLSGFTIREEGSVKKNETLILIDVSQSTEYIRDEMGDYVTMVLEECDDNNTVGIVAFGADQIYTSELNKATKFNINEFKGKSVDCDTSATGIANALTYAANLFSNANGARIIILSDGIETDGNAETVAKALASQGVRIDAVYFEAQTYVSEVQIDSVDMKHSVLLGEPVVTTVKISSKKETTATIKVFDTIDGHTTELTACQMNVNLKAVNGQEFVLANSPSFTSDGVHSIKVIIESNDDTIVQNNQFYSYVIIEDSHSILIVDGTSNNASESLPLFQMLKNESYDVDIVLPKDANSVDLSTYGELILMNCSFDTSDGVNNDLPQGFDTKVERYVSSGGGLLTTGGENTYYYGKYKSTALNDVLPIEVDPKGAGSKAIMVVIPTSSGMFGDHGNIIGSGKNKITRLVDSLRRALATDGVFSEKDYIGIIAYGGKNSSKKPSPELVLPLTATDNYMQIDNAISSLHNKQKSNTEYSAPLEMAITQLKAFGGSDTKHIIYIAGGNQTYTLPGKTQDAWKGLSTKAYKNYGITTTGVAFVPDTDKKDADGYTEAEKQLIKNNMQILANEGNGRYYETITDEDVMACMTEECKAVKTKLINNEGNYQPVIKTTGPVVAGLSTYTFPTITSYNGSSIKSGAAEVLVVEKDPIYSQWKYGNGKVGAFMSDITTSWAENYMSAEETKKMFVKICNDLFASNTSSLTADMSIVYDNDNYTTNTKVTINKDTAFDIGDAEIVEPDGAKQTIGLGFAAGSYTGKISTKKEGLYKISYGKYYKEDYPDKSKAGKYMAGQDAVDYTTFSYSKEYDIKYDNSAAFDLLNSLCDATKANGGTMFTKDESVFSPKIMYEVIDHNFQLPFMLASIILFILDVCARKFHFLWPTEWGKAGKEAA